MFHLMIKRIVHVHDIIIQISAVDHKISLTENETIGTFFHICAFFVILEFESFVGFFCDTCY